MPPWLSGVSPPHESGNPGTLAARLVLALALGWAVSAIYSGTKRGDATMSFRATIVLLTVLIAAVTQVIGDNVARAFSLVGALSIVRFRTVVQDTRDTAFVIFAVTVGMAVGAGDLWVAGLGLVVVGLAAFLMAGGRGAAAAEPRFQLTVGLTLGYDPDATLAEVFKAHVSDFNMVGVATGNRGASIEAVYSLRLLPGGSPAALLRDVNELDGVQSVQVRAVETSVR